MQQKTWVSVVLFAVAVAAGAFVATLVPSATASAAGTELNLASAPVPGMAVNAPSFADLAEKAIPSVVLITSEKKVETGNAGDFMLRRFFRGEPFGNDNGGEGRSKPRKEVRVAGGSGFFITSDGYILTNRHVVDGAQNLFVRTKDTSPSDPYKARLIGVDPSLDLALLKIDTGKTFQPLCLGDSDRLRVGDWLVVIGNPIAFQDSVSVGVVSGKGRRLEAGLGEFIQTDAAINFGNSGGPVLNAKGEVVGISTAIIRDSPVEGNGAIQGIGFALPISPVKRVIQQLASTGTVKRGYLGVTVVAMDRDRADYLKVPEGKGAYVRGVTPDSPGAKSGVQKDDVILSVDGNRIADSDALVKEISAHPPGEKVALTIWRNGQKIETSVVLGERPPDQPQEKETSSPSEEDDSAQGTGPGFSVRMIPPRMKEQMGEKSKVKGLLVTEVDPESSAARRGLAEGMVLLEMNGMPTTTLEEFQRAQASLKPGSAAMLRVIAPGGPDGGEISIFFRVPEK